MAYSRRHHYVQVALLVIFIALCILVGIKRMTKTPAEYEEEEFIEVKDKLHYQNEAQRILILGFNDPVTHALAHMLSVSVSSVLFEDPLRILDKAKDPLDKIWWIFDALFNCHGYLVSKNYNNTVHLYGESSLLDANLPGNFSQCKIRDPVVVMDPSVLTKRRLKEQLVLEKTFMILSVLPPEEFFWSQDHSIEEQCRLCQRFTYNVNVLRELGTSRHYHVSNWTYFSEEVSKIFEVFQLRFTVSEQSVLKSWYGDMGQATDWMIQYPCCYEELVPNSTTVAHVIT